MIDQEIPHTNINIGTRNRQKGIQLNTANILRGSKPDYIMRKGEI